MYNIILYKNDSRGICKMKQITKVAKKLQSYDNNRRNVINQVFTNWISKTISYKMINDVRLSTKKTQIFCNFRSQICKKYNKGYECSVFF